MSEQKTVDGLVTLIAQKTMQWAPEVREYAFGLVAERDARIAELGKVAQYWLDQFHEMSLKSGRAHDRIAELGKSLADLQEQYDLVGYPAALAAQGEPVGEVRKIMVAEDCGTYIAWSGSPLPVGTKLYAGRPPAAEPPDSDVQIALQLLDENRPTEAAAMLRAALANSPAAEPRKDAATAEQIAAARRMYMDEGRINIEDEAPADFADQDGAYVQAWVWVPWETEEQVAVPAAEQAEALKDAERYRWIRGGNSYGADLDAALLKRTSDGAYWLSGELLDKNIDAAMAGGAKT